MTVETPPAPIQIRTGPDLSSAGEAVGRLGDGRVAFVEGAAPSELVEAEIVRANKRFVRASTRSVLEPGPDRVAPRCPHFAECGGCTTQHVAAGAQTRSKNGAALESLRRIGGVDLTGVRVDAPWCGEPYGYRARVRFAVAPGPVVGFRRWRGHEIVEVTECPILTPVLGRALGAVREAGVDSDRIEEVEGVAADDTALVRLPNRLARRWRDGTSAQGVEFVRGRTRRSLRVDDGHGPLLIAPGVFAQSNPTGNAALVEYFGDLVESMPPPTFAIELYAGSGNLTRKLAGSAAEAIAVERDEDACRLAQAIRPAHVEISSSPVEAVLEALHARVSAVPLLVANPPRQGLAKSVAEGIARLRPDAMIYVSCNPATFARDLSPLVSSGLAVRRLRLFDLYPQTAHAELVALLER